MAWQGFALAFCAAFTHSLIDLLRKIASSRINTTQLVCLVSMLEGTLAFSFVAGQGTLTIRHGTLQEQYPFLFASCMSASLRLVSLLLYQTAIQLAPLSETIPYLSFTPAMLLITAFLLIGEQPSWQGLVGVVVVTAGGYMLAFSSSQRSRKKDDGSTEVGALKRATVSVQENMGSLEMGSVQLIFPDERKSGLVSAMEGASRSLQQLGDSKGSILMMLVAALWSLTSTFDKMGMAAAPTLASYLAVQRMMTAIPCIIYISVKDFPSIRLVYEQFWLLIGLAACELLTVLLYLWSLEYLFVSYAVAAKRSGILLSVLSGWLFFGEHIRDKIMYIGLMLVGMMMIVLAPEVKYNAHLRRP